MAIRKDSIRWAALRWSAIKTLFVEILDTSPEPPELTQREAFMGLVAADASVREIAAALSLSRNEVVALLIRIARS